MGYYITYNGTINFPAEDEPRLTKAQQDLNHRHDLKGGGRHPATGDPYEDKWFAWMPSRYHEDFHTVEAILERLGFEVDDRGELDHELYVNYDNKMGDEQTFLAELAICGAQIEIEYKGEDDHFGLLVSENGRLIDKAGRIDYEDTGFDVLHNIMDELQRFREWNQKFLDSPART